MANITNEELEVLRKTWEARIMDFRSGGQPQARWCEANGVSVRQLRYWLRKFPSHKAPSGSRFVKWAAVQADGPAKDEPPGSALCIRLGSAVIEVRDGYSPSLLLSVVKALQALC